MILIVNADDFGMTEGHNAAILAAYRSGIVTSTSLLANGYAFDQAVEMAKQVPGLGIGVHLTLTEGPSVATDVNALLGPDGKLPLSNQPLARALVTGKLPRQAIQREFEAQVQKIIGSGIKPTHIDGHKYIHVLPGISTIVAEIARQYAIPVMRVPYPLSDGFSRIGRLPGLAVLNLLGRMAHGVAQRAGLRNSDRVIGFVDTGHLAQPTIRRLLAVQRPGVTELLCHPANRSPQLEYLLTQGYRWIAGYQFENETAAVSDATLRHDLEGLGWSFQSFKCLVKQDG